ncbi:hypothetical protein ACGF5O_45295 [Streptomyces sp. NPDC048291]|uniref:hypothetical protein n=1 Tax=Streptomyces sp. NPDC048291 TaxID=3365530 RepID=UPI00371F112A
METLVFSPVGAAGIAFPVAAALVYVTRLRREQGLPNHPGIIVPWVVGLLVLPLGPWLFTFSRIVHSYAPDDVFGAWAVGLPTGLLLGTGGGTLWARSALKDRSSEQ